MNVLYSVTAYDRHPGDVITPWMVETIRRLRNEGVNVEVLAPAYRGSGSAEIDGVPVHRFRYAPAAWEDLTHDQTAPDRIAARPQYMALVPGYVLAGMRAARKLARTGRFDLMHVHWPIPHALFGMAARRAAEIPFISSFYSVEITWIRRRFPVFLPFLRHIVKTSDAVTAISSSTEAMVRELHDRPVARIPFGATVEPAGATVEPSGATAAPAEGASPPTTPENNTFDVLFAGRLVERKGVRYLLDALASMEADEGVRLHVVGDGPARAALEERARSLELGERAIFHGFVTKEALANRFAECGVFVLPAVVDAKGDVEGLGVVLIEALSYGKPVIASAAGGIVDIVKDGKTGWLVPPGDAAALAGAIRDCMRSPDRARALAEAGRAHVKREFGWPEVIRRLKALYADVAGRDQGGRTVESAREVNTGTY